MNRTLPHFWIRIYAVIIIATCLIAIPGFASHQKSIIEPLRIELELKVNNTEVAFFIYPGLNASGKDLILWLPSEHGLSDSLFSIALSLSSHESNTEVWVADLFSSLFLATQASSIDKVPGELLYELVKKIHRKTQKRIYILSSGKGALLAMRASHYWLQDSVNSDQFGGLILLYPNLFTRTPEPGNAAEYFPVTDAVNAPIYILQPENSPWRWQLATLQQKLVNANAVPYISILPNVRDRFFFRPDATKNEQIETKNLAALIQKSIYYLKSKKITHYTIPPKIQMADKKKFTKQAAQLKLYTKDPAPPALQLQLLSGHQTSLSRYRGKVVIINFWASWCPPCVHEMPSMETLYQRYSTKNFTILAVNMAEDKATINDFLQNRVNVSFPILLDHEGKALKDWQIIAFPSSYIIDTQGKIRYALFGSILWDQPEVIEIIDKLLKEPVN